ncbi:MAG TPA: nucleoside-diphosphate sugar epimerase/dehydratase [Thermoanaerobaculia bacterium]|nr:nucleoside-diphosphate sugar epimerase/dehydratase [Thermoanaerobaculia bacterium]
MSPVRSLLHQAVAARVALLFVFHVIVFASVYALAWLLRFEFTVPPEWVVPMRSSMPVILGVQLFFGAVFGFYRGWWRYVGITDVVRLGIGLTSATAMLVLLWYTGSYLDIPTIYFKVPRGVLLIDWAFAVLTLLGARMAVRLGRDRLRGTDMPDVAKRVLIVGAGDAGEALAREIQHRPQLGMKVVGFIDDQRSKWSSEIRGIKVTGPIAEVGAIADALRVDEALIAIPSASGHRVREIINHLGAANVAFKTMPGIDQLVSGKIQVTQLRPVNVEDLLRRNRIDLPGDPVRDLFKGKRVMVTGAGGTIGSELAVQIAGFEPESITLVERSELALYEVRKRLSREAADLDLLLTCNLVDICDVDVVDALIAREKPHIVLHAAAHKHVPLGEENPPEYIRNNATATRQLAELCAKHDVRRFVCISTDKAINPSSVMGASKRAAEILLLDLAQTTSMKVAIVRFGNVIGSSGSVIPLFMEQIAAGGPVTVTHPDVTRYFIRTSEAISLVLQAATLGDAGQIFMLDMGEPVKIAELARDLIRLSNHTEDEIQIVFTGLRPGEKLFEEIRLHGEAIRATEHPQIVVTEAPQPNRQQVQAWLKTGARVCDKNVAVEALRALVPEFRTPGAAPVSTVSPARVEAKRVPTPFVPAPAPPIAG